MDDLQGPALGATRTPPGETTVCKQVQGVYGQQIDGQYFDGGHFKWTALEVTSSECDPCRSK